MDPREAQNVPEADVTLLLEGTYPYVLGGVSAWVDQIIRGLPELTFSLFYIGAKREPEPKLHFQLPPNVLCLREVYMHDRLPDRELKPARTPKPLRARIYQSLEAFYLAADPGKQCEALWPLIESLREAGESFTFGNLLRDPECWGILKRVYATFCPEESFIDFFWTSRFLHLPLWSLWRSSGLIPEGKVYHSPCAGYAGLMGTLAARTRKRPFLLTEHGIYTKERITEISQAEWIYESENARIDYTQGLGGLKRMWINLFSFLGQVAYSEARRIVTLYEGNAALEVEFGADSRKIQIIPNGIQPSKFDGIRDQILQRWNPEPPKKIVGFIGRVVPIKDVKTLLRAARLVCERCPDVEFLIAGPYSEDPTYFEDCRKIVKLLDIESRVHFLGMQKLMEVLPRMDIMVLTSISEGLPLVVLEAMAAGIPAVASDVGACRELVFGRTPEDRALGRAGRITKILSPQETAAALIFFLTHPEQWRQAGIAGRQRAERFYTMTQMIDSYRELYRDHINANAGTTSPPDPEAPGQPGAHPGRPVAVTHST